MTAVRESHPNAEPCVLNSSKEEEALSCKLSSPSNLGYIPPALAADFPSGRYGVQGCTKRWTLSCVNLGGKVAFCLPTAASRTQIFHLSFTHPGAHLLVHPCTSSSSARAVGAERMMSKCQFSGVSLKCGEVGKIGLLTRVC